MKLFLMIFVLTPLLVSTLLAEEEIYGLGMVKVTEVIYLQNGEFFVTLSLPSSVDSETNPLFFNNEPTLSFKFQPDKLDGICVIVTPDQEITRRDILLSGPSFINLLLSNMESDQPLNMSCAFTEIQSDSEIEPAKYVLNYFQVNRVN